MEPKYCGRTLLGGSMMLRLAVFMCGLQSSESNWGPQGINFCVSGQTIGQLQNRIKLCSCSFDDIMVMIGTNDFLNGRKMRDIKRRFSYLLRTLKKASRSVIILIIPPIPRLGQEGVEKVKIFNKFVMDDCGKLNIRYIDVYSKFLNRDGTVKIELFESHMGKQSRMREDLIHWNKVGMTMVNEIITNELNL